MKNLPKIQLHKIFNLNLTKHLTINLWLAPTILCAALCGYIDTFLLSFSIALIHEFSHIICAKALKVSVKKITLYPFGVCAKLSGDYINNSDKEFLIAFMGPLSNIIMFWLFSAVKSFLPASVPDILCDLNLAMCMINLVPALPLDGGRMLKSILTHRFGIIRSYNFMIKLSRILTIALLIAAVLILFVTDFNFSLILIGVFLLQNLCSEQQTLSIIALKEILYSRSKISDFRELPVKTICVDKSLPARAILKHLTYDFFYTVLITDNSSEILKTVTETQVLSALTEKGIQIKYGEV